MAVATDAVVPNVAATRSVPSADATASVVRSARTATAAPRGVTSRARSSAPSSAVTNAVTSAASAAAGRTSSRRQGGQRERRPEGQQRSQQPRSEQPRPEPQRSEPPRGDQQAAQPVALPPRTDAGGQPVEGQRTDQPERIEGERGERTGRRSRRGGRRRRREPGESFGGEQRAEGAPVEGGETADAPRPAAPAWTPPFNESEASAQPPRPAPVFESPPPVTGAFDFERIPERVIERPATVARRRRPRPPLRRPPRLPCPSRGRRTRCRSGRHCRPATRTEPSRATSREVGPARLAARRG